MVLAKFSTIKALPFSIFLLLCCSPLIWGVISEGPIGMLVNNKGLAVYIVAGWVGLPFTLSLSFLVLFQMLFKNNAAVWTDGDSLIYMHSAFLKVARKDVKSIEIRAAESYSFIKLINVQLTDGTVKKIGTVLLRESREELLPRLRHFVTQGDPNS